MFPFITFTKYYHTTVLKSFIYYIYDILKAQHLKILQNLNTTYQFNFFILRPLFFFNDICNLCMNLMSTENCFCFVATKPNFLSFESFCSLLFLKSIKAPKIRIKIVTNTEKNQIDCKI